MSLEEEQVAQQLQIHGSTRERSGGDDVCASCGIKETDEMKLMKCNACELVRYCSVDCVREHTSHHVEEECKRWVLTRMLVGKSMKWVRELLRDQILFKQPESNHVGDCPICTLPMSDDVGKNTMCSCCSKVICNGCIWANILRERDLAVERGGQSLESLDHLSTILVYLLMISGRGLQRMMVPKKIIVAYHPLNLKK